MALVTAILGALPVLLKIILMIMQGLKKTPSEERRDSLNELREAMKKSKQGDNKELSKWISKRL